MKKLTILIAVALFAAATACTNEDTKTPVVWRVVEPRLAGADKWQACKKLALKEDRVVEEVQCGPTKPERAECDVLITRTEAVLALSSEPRCTAKAIDALEDFARTDPAAKTDLAGAYYVHAQRENDPAHFLTALDRAEEAVAEASGPAAHFNRALALEVLGLPDDAIATWDKLLGLGEESEWANEARQRRSRLMQQRGQAASVQWPRALEQLPAALAARNGAMVAKLIAPYPTSAVIHFEEELLPECAAAPSPANVDRVRLYAIELSKRLDGDPYPIHAVDAIARAKDLPTLQRGHRAFVEARRAELAYQSAGRTYQEAAELLARSGSPLALRARLGHARALSNEPIRTPALQAVDFVATRAKERAYRHLGARAIALRAHIFSYQSLYSKSLDQWDAAAAEYKRLRDDEGFGVVQTRKGGVLRAAGNGKLAWRELFQTIGHAHRIAEARHRHVLAGELAETALALRHPRAALLYQSSAIRMIEHEIRTVKTPERTEIMDDLRKNLSVAYRKRGQIEIELEHYNRATLDLDESNRLDMTTEDDPNIRRLVETRRQEAMGQRLLSARPQQSVAAFTKALELSKGDEFTTQRAWLFAQRAEAQKRAGNMPEFESDLRDALKELHAEEARILAGRERGAGEAIWSSYFSRFQETYRLLIRQLTEQRRHAEAFAYAERARAFEPLDLILRLDVTPRTFRDLARGSFDLTALQKKLPPGTFIIEYAVLDDRTYTWILSRDQGVVVTQRADREDVKRWSEAIEHAARLRNAPALEDALDAPYEGLIAGPLSLIRKMPGAGKEPRLVIVPDVLMHGLPFTALRDPVTKHYLIEDAQVSIAASTLLYVFSRLRNEALAAAGDRSILAVGDPAFDENLPAAQGMGRLHHALLEAEEIHKLYAPQPRPLLGADATAPAFLEQARKSAIVHVAAHAIVNRQAPSQSLILLAPSAGHSGALTAEELLTRLNTDRTRLVVLSACSSAGGLPVGPEGVAPLVRPLIGSGIPAVIGSLWNVGDATAKELLVSFHRHYQKGSDAAESLRAAQLELLRSDSPGLKPAIAWAAFQVIGHASSPYASAHDIGKEKPP